MLGGEEGMIRIREHTQDNRLVCFNLILKYLSIKITYQLEVYTHLGDYIGIKFVFEAR